MLFVQYEYQERAEENRRLASNNIYLLIPECYRGLIPCITKSGLFTGDMQLDNKALLAYCYLDLHEN